MDERLSLLITEWLLFIIRSPLALRQRRDIQTLFRSISREKRYSSIFFTYRTYCFIWHFIIMTFRIRAGLRNHFTRKIR